MMHIGGGDRYDIMYDEVGDRYEVGDTYEEVIHMIYDI